MARQILKYFFLPHHIAALLLAVLLLLPAWPLLTNLSINNAPEAYFPPSDPAVIFENKLREQFPQDQILAALFQGNEIYSDQFIKALHSVVRRMNKHPLVERVVSATTMDHIAGSEDGFIVEPLVNVKRLKHTSEKQRREAILRDRFAPGFIVSEDGNSVSLIVRPKILHNSYQRLELETELRKLIEEAGIGGNLVAIAGQVPLDVAQLRSTIHDTLVFTPITLSVGLVLLWWMFRRPFAVAVGMVAMSSVISSTVALLVMTGEPYTLVSSMIPPLMAALTVAFLIHFYNAMAHASARGFGGVERVKKAMDEIRRPSGFSALTTAVGLASLAFSPVQPVKYFGIASAAGIAVLYLVVIVLIPPLFIRWDKQLWPRQQVAMRWLNSFVQKLTHLGIRRAGWVAGILLILLAAGSPLILKVVAETDIYEFFSDDHPINRSTKLVEDRLSGVTSLEIVFDGQKRDVFKEPAVLKYIEKFRDWSEKMPEVDRSISIVDIIEEMNWAFHGEDKKYRTLPDKRELISQYFFIYDGRDLYDIVNREFTRTRLVLSLNVHGANEINAVMDKITEYFTGNKPANIKWTIAGLGRLFADQEELLIQGQVRSLWVAIGLIFLLMLVLWRSLSAAVLCMIPNLSPIILIFILMGGLGIWLDMATVMIASVAVGIAVDDTIHVFHGYSKRVAAGVRPSWALARTYRQAGRAITATTLVLSAQFFLLFSSAFVPTAEFGLLTTIGLLAALIFDLLLLPAILILLTGKRKKRVPHALAEIPAASEVRASIPATGRINWHEKAPPVIAGISGIALTILLAAIYIDQREKMLIQQAGQTGMPVSVNRIKQLKEDITQLQAQLVEQYQTNVGIQEAERTAHVSEKDVTKPVLMRDFQDSLTSGGLGPMMVRIPAGSFDMGSPASSIRFDERPRHTVSLGAFAIGKYEVSVSEYNRFVIATGRGKLPGKGKLPAVTVSWTDAVAYTQWLSQQTGQRYRLPSEAEWEYAASGGASTAYWWGPVLSQNRANCFGCGSLWDRQQPAPVGSFGANGFGLYDTAGNVLEWVQDCYHQNYQGAPSDGSVWLGGDCGYRIARGGAFDSVPDSIRHTKRSKFDPRVHLNNLGFRVVRE